MTCNDSGTLVPRDTAGVIAPPPLLFGGTLAAGVMIDYVNAWQLSVAAFLRLGLGSALIFGAVFILVIALGLFRRARTRPEPWQPTTTIVDTGVYGYTRNPMYVGMALAYAGVALLANSPAAMLLLPGVLILIHFGVIRREEIYLEGKFGADYLRYKARVRRWL